jgi:3-oxoacyl-ACP reductase-like protein
MSIFATILNKIFHHGGGAAPAAVPAAPPASALAQPSAPAPSAVAAQPAAAAPSAPAQPVDVEAVLTQLAEEKGKPSNWRTSIVDLLDLLDPDSSLSARKELANELNIHFAADGSAEENIALHMAVMQKLAENGGKVPADLKD